MRRSHLILFGTFLAAAFTAMPVYAGWYTNFHNTHDSLVWHNSDGRRLELHSDNGAGIEVTKVSPADLWGLQKGDVLLSVDGHPVKHVDELFKQLQASKPAAVKIQLRRSASEQLVTIADSDYSNITNPQP
jgi:S1-C subfamily serine protease